MELPNSFGRPTCVACQIVRISEMLRQGRPAHPLGFMPQSVLTRRSQCLSQEADLGKKNVPAIISSCSMVRLSLDACKRQEDLPLLALLT